MTWALVLACASVGMVASAILRAVLEVGTVRQWLRRLRYGSPAPRIEVSAAGAVQFTGFSHRALVRAVRHVRVVCPGCGIVQCPDHLMPFLTVETPTPERTP